MVTTRNPNLPNGLRLKNPQLSIYAAITQLAPVMQVYAEKGRAHIVADEYLNLIDLRRPSKEVTAKPREMIWSVLRRGYNERQMKLGINHPLHNPLRFSILFGETSQGTLAYPYAGQPQMLTHLCQSLPDLFEDYSSPHNADSLDKQQQERRLAWMELGTEEGTFLPLPVWSLTALETYPFTKGPQNTTDTANTLNPQSQRLQRALVQIAINTMAKDPQVKTLLEQRLRSSSINPDLLLQNAQEVARTTMGTPAWQDLIERSLPQPFPSVLTRWSEKPASALDSVVPQLQGYVEELAAQILNRKFTTETGVIKQEG